MFYVAEHVSLMIETRLRISYVDHESAIPSKTTL